MADNVQDPSIAVEGSPGEKIVSGVAQVVSPSLQSKLKSWFEGHPILDALLLDVGFNILVKWGWDHFTKEVDAHKETVAKKHANKFTFAEIMGELQSKEETEIVFHQVTAFMTQFSATYPDRLEDMNHFMNNVANIGQDGEIGDSVQFLRGFAEIADFDRQVSLLETIRFIGPNARDHRDRVIDVAKGVLQWHYRDRFYDVVAFLQDAGVLGLEAADYLLARGNEALAYATDYVNATPDGGEVSRLQRSRDRREAARARLEAARARL